MLSVCDVSDQMVPHVKEEGTRQQYKVQKAIRLTEKGPKTQAKSCKRSRQGSGKEQVQKTEVNLREHEKT